MRHLALSAALIAATAGAAHAQPEPACNVVIARAPAAVKVEIERWTSTVRCARGLELRVVESPEGLYLFARDDRGFTRERLVPDAAAAGLLVASWIADDSVDGVWMYGPPAPVVGTPALAPAPAMTGEPPRDRGQGLRTFGIVSGIAGLGLVAGGLHFHVQAKQISDEISDHAATGAPWPDDILERERQGQNAERMQMILLAGGGALVATGVITYLVGRSRAKPEAMVVVPAVSSSGGGVGLVGRF